MYAWIYQPHGPELQSPNDLPNNNALRSWPPFVSTWESGCNSNALIYKTGKTWDTSHIVRFTDPIERTVPVHETREYCAVLVGMGVYYAIFERVCQEWGWMREGQWLSYIQYSLLARKLIIYTTTLKYSTTCLVLRLYEKIITQQINILLALTIIKIICPASVAGPHQGFARINFWCFTPLKFSLSLFYIEMLPIFYDEL